MGNPLLTLIQDRYRVQALRTASDRTLSRLDPNYDRSHSYTNTPKNTKLSQPGQLSIPEGDGDASSPTPHTAPPAHVDGPNDTPDAPRSVGGSIRNGRGILRRDPEKAATHPDDADASPSTNSPSPPLKSEHAGHGDSAITDTGPDEDKLPMSKRMIAGSKRFCIHFKDAVCHSYINILLIAVPAGIAAKIAGLNASIVFAINAVAIVPLAGLLAHATESVASRLGDTLGALLNVSFGNAVELIIFIIALVKNEIRIVQASLLGSILANLLLILGMAFLFGGLRYREQIYNSTVTQMSACLLSLSVMSLLLPTAFHASFKEDDLREADEKVIKVSRGTSVVLLLVYVLYLVFQLKSHAYMYESTPQEIIDEESHPGVLADIMNSSSSDRSSSSDSSSSDDSDASGSVATASRRVKQLFKNRRRRKSSASTSTSHTMSALPSVISSPSTERPTPDYFRDPNDLSPPNGAQLGVIGHEAVVDNDRQGLTHALDWAQRTASNETSKSPEPPKRRKKQRFGKKSKKNRNANVEEKDDAKVIAGSNPQPKVSFSDDVEMGEALPASDSPSQGKLTLNMRGLSRARPALSSYLSSTVFFSQPPHPATPGAALPTDAPGSVSVNGLRRTNSLPDRLNRQSAPAPGPLPPYQHQIRKTTSGLSSVPSAVDGVEEPQYDMSRTAAIMLLLISTGLVAICAEFMVDAIPGMLKNSPVNEAFVGLIILPIVGNAAEHVTAVTVAAKNKMDLAIGVAVGSSIQIALFVTPVVVLLGWALDTNMSLYFNLFETISLFVTAFVVNFLVLDGRSNYLEGSLLIAAYVIIALGAFYYPSTRSQSEVGSGVRDGS